MTESAPRRRGCCAKLLIVLAVIAGLVGIRAARRWAGDPVLELARDEGPVHALAFAANDSLLVTRTNDFVSVFALPSGQRLAHRRAWAGDGVGTAIVTSRGDAVICESHVYSLPDLAERGELPHAALACSPEGDLIAFLDSAAASDSASSDSGVSISSLPSGAALPLVGSARGRIAISRTPHRIAARLAGKIGTNGIGIWDDKGALEGTIDGNFAGVAFDDSGRLHLAKRYGGLERRDAWDKPGRAPDAAFAVKCDESFLRHVAFSASFQFRATPADSQGVLAWGDDMGGAQVRSLDDGAVLWGRSGAHACGVSVVTASADGHWVATGASDCVVRLWRLH